MVYFVAAREMYMQAERVHKSYQGKRLASNKLLELVSLQTQCLLACLNCLEVLEEDYIYIDAPQVTPRPSFNIDYNVDRSNGFPKKIFQRVTDCFCQSSRSSRPTPRFYILRARMRSWSSSARRECTKKQSR